jgi:hypothetical protein
MSVAETYRSCASAPRSPLAELFIFARSFVDGWLYQLECSEDLPARATIRDTRCRGAVVEMVLARLCRLKEDIYQANFRP